jgi:hypothetical protein
MEGTCYTVLKSLGQETVLLREHHCRLDGKIVLIREKESSMPTARAGGRSRAPMPRLGLLLSMGAGEADGGRRGWWGQTRLVGQARSMGAASHRPHARVHQHRRLRKPPGQIPSQKIAFKRDMPLRNSCGAGNGSEVVVQGSGKHSMRDVEIAECNAR